VFGSVGEYIDAFDEEISQYDPVARHEVTEDTSLWVLRDDWSRNHDEAAWFVAPREMEVVVVLASFDTRRGTLEGEIDVLEGSDACEDLDDTYWTWLYDPGRNPDYDRFDEFTEGLVRLDDFSSELYSDLLDEGSSEAEADCISRNARTLLFAEGTVGRAVFELRSSPEVAWTEAPDLESLLADARANCAE
jgi:hypothetical protein